jgi:hypothetical protein
MSTDNHTPIPSTKVDANAATFNSVFADLDAAIGPLSTLTTATKANTVVAINEVEGRVDALVASAGSSNAEIVDARAGETTLGDRLDLITQAGEVLASTLASTASIGATSVVVKNWPNAIPHGCWIVIDPFSADCEVRKVTSVSTATLSFAGALEYAHAADDLVLISYRGEINALWFGVSTGASAAVNGAAITRMVAQAKKAKNPRSMYIPGATEPYLFDTPIVLTGAHGLHLRGDGCIHRADSVSTYPGTILSYTPTDASNAIELSGNWRDIKCSEFLLLCATGHTGVGIYAEDIGYTPDMLHNISISGSGGIGFRTVDCYGSSVRNLAITSCATGASINGMNAGYWIGGKVRGSTGYGIVFGDATDVEAGIAVFTLQSIAIENNAGGGINFSKKAGVAQTSHLDVNIFNCYFEANYIGANNTYDLKLGDDTGDKIRCRYFTITGNRFSSALYVGDTCIWTLGQNEFRHTAKVVLAGSASSSEGVVYGSPALITTAPGGTPGFGYGGCHRVLFLDPDDGAVTIGIDGISSSENRISNLSTPLLKTYAVGAAAATVNWRSLAGGALLILAHSGATNFTEITNAPDGTMLWLLATNGNTTIKHDGNKILLRGAADYVMSAGDVLVLVCYGSSHFYEVSRTAA